MDNIFPSAILLVIKETLSKREIKEKNKTYKKNWKDQKN